MPPKVKRDKSRSKFNSSQSLEDSISAPSSLAESASLTLPPLVTTLPKSPSLSPATSSPKSPSSGKPKGRRGRSRKKKNQEEERPETPPYTGPPPDEELLDEVLIQTKPLVVGSRPDNYIESIYKMIREGETGIGQEINCRNYYGFTPLAVASAAGDASLVALLLERHADVSMASTGRAELPLHHAATYARPVVAQLLLEHVSRKGIVDARNCTGWTALHCCAASGDRTIFKLLLSAKAELDTRNPLTGNEHALHIAAREKHMDIIEILLAGDADVNCTDSLSRTPLHMAASVCSADGVSLLLRSRADPHHRGGPSSLTPLDFVPALHDDMDERETVLRFLSSYSRKPPSPFRSDVRFDRRDSRDLI